MDVTCYLNGHWLPLAQATVSVLDRGFIFGDGVYEVIPVDTVTLDDGQRVRAPFRVAEHLARLSRSLAAVRIENPLTEPQWIDVLKGLIARHPWPRQTLYVQVTRGVAPRDHGFPQGVRPTVFAMSNPWPEIPSALITHGVPAITHADERWLHCDIKSISLLGNILMKQHALEQGASEAILLRDGLLTEGSSTNVFVVKDGLIRTPAKSHFMLPGITYDAALDVAHAQGARLEVGPVSEAQLRSADEIWLSSSGREIMAVNQLDGVPVGTGVPGPLFKAMLDGFQHAKRADAHTWCAQHGDGWVQGDQ